MAFVRLNEHVMVCYN